MLPDSLQRLAIRADVVRSPHALARLSRLVSLDLVVGQDEKQSKVAAVRCGEVHLSWIFCLLLRGDVTGEVYGIVVPPHCSSIGAVIMTCLIMQMLQPNKLSTLQTQPGQPQQPDAARGAGAQHPGLLRRGVQPPGAVVEAQHRQAGLHLRFLWPPAPAAGLFPPRCAEPLDWLDSAAVIDVAIIHFSARVVLSSDHMPSMLLPL